jgi:hypothetical protein
METQDSSRPARSSAVWPFFDTWVGRTTAVIGLIASLGGGITWWVNHHRQHAQREAELRLAEVQAARGDYAASLQTCGDLLKANPLDRAALDDQLNAAMLWTENFSVVVPEGGNATDSAAPALDQIFAILESGLSRAPGTRAADIQAHLGWAHWLNQRIAEREFGSAAEQNFRAALALDPHNVYANAMLAGWMLQTGGSVSDAAQPFALALATGKARPFVRGLQIGGYLSSDGPGARAELMRAASDMRKNGEPLDSDLRRRILDFCCDPAYIGHEQLVEALSAVSADNAWSTYLWLETGGSGASDAADQALRGGFIQATLLEISGKPQPALAQFRQLQQQLAHSPGPLRDAVDAEIGRLARRS